MILSIDIRNFSVTDIIFSKHIIEQSGGPQEGFISPIIDRGNCIFRVKN